MKIFDQIKAEAKRAKASVAQSQTDSSVVAAVAGKKIQVLAVAISGPTATAVTFNTKPAGAGTAISSAVYYASNTIQVLPMNEAGWFETNVGEGLTVTTGAGGTSGIMIVYTLE